MWKKTNSAWDQAVAMQQALPCSKLKELAIPHQIVDKCYADVNSDQIIDNPL